MSSRINRITLFKCPSAEAQGKLLAAYDELAKTQSKDGKPYILYLSAGLAVPDQRSQGFTVASKSEFASLDDMRFYDEECPAHIQLKQTAMTLGMTEKPLVVYFTGEPALMTPHAK